MELARPRDAMAMRLQYIGAAAGSVGDEVRELIPEKKNARAFL